MQIQKTRTYTDDQWKRKLAWQKARRTELGVGSCKLCGEPKDLIHKHYCEECRASMLWLERLQNRIQQSGIDMTREDYLSASLRQDHKCAICKTKTPGGKGGWHIDHCHATNRFRGLLCHDCNVSLGWIEKKFDDLGAMIAYLEALVCCAEF